MPELRELQQAFLGHLLGKPSEIVNTIESTADTSADERLSIYASGYRLRLKEALMTDYERLHAYLGDEMFHQIMDVYIDSYQSHFTSLRDYSQQMPALLAKLEPFCKHPEILEIESIERAFNMSFDAADCDCIEIGSLSHLAPERWPEMQLQFHASISVLHTQHNSLAIWRALSDEQLPPSLEKDSTAWLIWRKGLISHYRAISNEEDHALKIAMQGGNFSAVCEGLTNYYSEEETPQKAVIMLQTWINEKMVCAINS